MSKAILILDMPSDCEECPLYDEDQMRCYYLKNDKYAVDVIPKWCPLKPLPERRQDIEEATLDAMFNDGWNACIDELEGKDD